MGNNLPGTNLVPGLIDLSFVNNLVSSILQGVLPFPPVLPTPNPGLREELLEVVGSVVEVATPGGIVEGILSVVRNDYIVITAETASYEVPFNNILGVTVID